MAFLSKLDAAARFAFVRATNRRMPIVVRWQTTNRCTARCRYCEIWKAPGDELSFGEATAMLREFHGLGTRRLCYSGGEPLLREDIDELIAFGERLGLSQEMNSNGVLLDRHLPSLGRLALVKISLDGPPAIHDALRGAPMHDRIVQNLEACRAAGVRFGFTTTLTRDNTSLETVEHVLGLAERFGTFAAFQPVVPTTPWGTGDMAAIAPEPERMRAVFLRLIEEKRRRPARIRNSLAGLGHVLDWPRFPRMRCVAGIVFVVVESNGELYACERTAYPPGTAFPNVRAGVRPAFDAVVLPDCPGCGFCGANELSFLWNRRLSVWREVARIAGLGKG